MIEDLIKRFWECMDKQKWEDIYFYFLPSANIYWPNTNERFSVDEFVTVNSKYPGAWNIRIERVEKALNVIITVAKVSLAGGGEAFHATSFFELSDDGKKIAALSEYWGNDGTPPEWRAKLKLGSRVQ